MPGKAAQLAIQLSESGAEATAAGLDKVGSAAASMGSKVEDAGRSAEKGAAGLDRTAEGADEVASKGAQAAGALGGLGDLIGGKFGAAMQTGGIALQAAADSGDLLNAALENSVVSTVRAKAATVAKTVADKASAGATRVMTVAQKALNLAQRTSPIGLIVTGVLLLAGALVLAYKRSATFRAVVDKAMSVARAGVQVAVGAFQDLGSVVGKVAGFIGKVIGTEVQGYVRAFQLGQKLILNVWSTIRDKGQAAFHALIAPIQSIIDLIDSILDKIKSIHLPKAPDLNPFNRGGSGAAAGGSSTTTGDTITMTVNVYPAPGTSAVEAQTSAQAMMDAIDQRLRSVGRRAVFAR